MLTSETIRKIESFAYAKPRSVDEIAKHIGKNWRTADRYIAEIEKEYGTISTRVFREGSRGALKVVFYSGIEKASSTVFQQLLEEDILRGKKKEDFSGFDIFQFVSDAKKSASVERKGDEGETDLPKFASALMQAKKQVLIFSGNLSFINMKTGKTDFFSVLEAIAKKGVSIKIVCRVDLAGKGNIERIVLFKNWE